jgi:hypothetical protein
VGGNQVIRGPPPTTLPDDKINPTTAAHSLELAERAFLGLLPLEEGGDAAHGPAREERREKARRGQLQTHHRHRTGSGAKLQAADGGGGSVEGTSPGLPKAQLHATWLTRTSTTGETAPVSSRMTHHVGEECGYKIAHNTSITPHITMMTSR